MQESSAQPKQTFSSSSLLETNKNRASRTAIAKSLGKKKNKTKSRSSAETSATGDLPTDLPKRQRQQKRLSLQWIRSHATKMATRKHPKRLAVLAVSKRNKDILQQESNVTNQTCKTTRPDALSLFIPTSSNKDHATPTTGDEVTTKPRIVTDPEASKDTVEPDQGEAPIVSQQGDDDNDERVKQEAALKIVGFLKKCSALSRDDADNDSNTDSEDSDSDSETSSWSVRMEQAIKRMAFDDDDDEDDDDTDQGTCDYNLDLTDDDDDTRGGLVQAASSYESLNESDTKDEAEEEEESPFLRDAWLSAVELLGFSKYVAEAENMSQLTPVDAAFFDKAMDQSARYIAGDFTMTPKPLRDPPQSIAFRRF